MSPLIPRSKKPRPDNPIHTPPSPVVDGPSPLPPAPEPAGRIGIFRPLRHRDFALLWAGMTVSLVGDGIFLVALAFQVYDLSDSPSALSLAFFAWTAPMIVFFLLSGVLSDRMDRRLLMILADVLRGITIGVMGFMSVTGSLRLSHVIALSVVYGIGDALFYPPFTAIVPDILPKDLLVEANSLAQFVRPLTQRLIGPALGGILIAAFAPGHALLVDGGTFAVSAVAVGMMSSRPRTRVDEDPRSVLEDIREGLRFVRSHTWLWGTLLSASVGLFCFIGPMEVLIPYVVRHDMGGDAGDYGIILAAGGVGALIISFLMGQRGLPRRHITFMYTVWGIGVLLIGAFAFLGSVWQGMVVSLFMAAMFAAGMIVWGTLMQKLVPSELLGRVSSLDWLVSTALVPLSFIVTGPLAESIGVHVTLALAGIAGSALTFVFLLLPGIHATEKHPLFTSDPWPYRHRDLDVKRVG